MPLYRAVVFATRDEAGKAHPELGFRPDIVTDQTAAHDALEGYIPAGFGVAEASALSAVPVSVRRCGSFCGYTRSPHMSLTVALIHSRLRHIDT